MHIKDASRLTCTREKNDITTFGILPCAKRIATQNEIAENKWEGKVVQKPLRVFSLNYWELTSRQFQFAI